MSLDRGPGALKSEKSVLFLFCTQGPGPSEVAGGLVLTERSKTLAPGSHAWAHSCTTVASLVPLVAIF